MAVGKKMALVLIGLVVFVAGGFVVQRVRADRADARVNEILGQAEVEHAAYLRELMLPLVDDLDNGLYWLSPGEVDEDLIASEPWVAEACEVLLNIEIKAVEALSEVDSNREQETARRWQVHASFVQTAPELAYFAALYDRGVIDVEPLKPPFENLDHSRQISKFRNLTLRSNGAFDGLDSLGPALHAPPNYEITTCVADGLAEHFAG